MSSPAARGTVREPPKSMRELSAGGPSVLGMTNAVLVEGLVKRFGENTALAGVDLAVAEGTVLGLLGPNGTGKTTDNRNQSTKQRPDADRTEDTRLDVVTHPDRVRATIGLTGQYA